MRLESIVSHLDQLLDHGSARDYSGACNGLQIESSKDISRIAVAVDAHLEVLEDAVEAGADLLIVHHGLTWSPLTPIKGAAFRKVKCCLDAGLAVYASHLPLDAHPEFGNTAGLSNALGLRGGLPWLDSHGHMVGLRFSVDLEREALIRKLEEITGQVRVLPWGPERVSQLGIVTGGAGGELARVAEDGLDTFLTGEGPHWTDGLARDHGINVLYGGHYATEVFGVQSLGNHLEQVFGLPWVFLDHPSGL